MNLQLSPLLVANNSPLITMKEKNEDNDELQKLSIKLGFDNNIFLLLDNQRCLFFGRISLNLPILLFLVVFNSKE